ncbi:MAG: hypothetical protein JOZ81_01530 [Chloroflexi bacterium]|nr:hypothetical protein [Chloroflexota bacterium]
MSAAGFTFATPVLKTLAGGACANNWSLIKITLTVSSTDGRSSETVDVVKYKP